MLELAITDMTCGGCVASITRLVKSLDAGANINADLASKRVKIESAVEASTIVAAIANAGYHPVMM